MAVATDDLSTRTRLNLGSGQRYDKTAVNLDLTPHTSPDVVHNLNVTPWPFPDNRFDHVEMRDVLEHLEDTLAVIEELHRICRAGATIEIAVPHFSSNGAYTDPTHLRYFSAFTFDYFTEGHPQNFYTRCRFKIAQRQVVFRPTLFNKLVHRLFCWRLQRWEERWAWMFPAWFVYVRLEVVKP